MPPSPICLVSDNSGPFNPTTNGLNINPGDPVAIVLQSPAGITNWYLQVGLVVGSPPVVVPGTGTDELQGSPPVLVGTNGAGLVTGGPASTVTITAFPPAGSAVLFSSTITGGFGQITTTFALFALTTGGYRVGAAGMSREGSTAYGWVPITNAAIRHIGGGGGVTSVSGASPITITGPTATPTVNFSILSQAQGDIVYFNGTNWVRLPAGMSGQFLETLGPLANPTWATLPLPMDLNITGEQAGDLLYYNGSNWVRLAKGTAGQFLETGSTGPMFTPSWATAVTSVSGSTTIGITGTPSVPIVSLSLSGQVQGDLLYYNGTNWVRLPAGTSGQFLETLGTGMNPTWVFPTLAGDVTGPSNNNVVTAIQGIPTPAGITAAASDTFVTQAAQIFTAPSSFYFDSTNGVMWIGDWSSPTLHAINVTTLQAVASIPLTPYFNRNVRRVTGDANYVYVCSPQNTSSGLVLIISKATHTVVGILTVSVAARDMAPDGSGNLWVVRRGTNVQQFTAADIASAISNFSTPQPSSGPTVLAGMAVHTLCWDPVDSQLWVGTFDQSPFEQLYQLNSSGTLLNTYTASSFGPSFSNFNGLVYFNGYVWCGTDRPSILQVNPATFPGGGSVVLTTVPGVGTATIDPYADPYTTSVLFGSEGPTAGPGNGVITRINATTGAVTDQITVANANTNTVVATASSISLLWVAPRGAAGIDLYTNTPGSETLTTFYTGPLSLVYTPYVAGFSDNSSEERTRRANWLRRNEFVSGGEGGNNVININNAPYSTHISTPLLDNGSQVAGSGIAIISDRVYFCGWDSENNHGALYGVDLYQPQGVSSSGVMKIYGDSPTDFIGVRAMTGAGGNSQRDYLFGIFPNSRFVNLGYLNGASPNQAFSQVYQTTFPGSVVPVRTCYWANGGTHNAEPQFFISGNDGNIYVSGSTSSGTLTSVFSTGDLPGAMFVDDAGYLWVLYTTSLKLVKFSITGTTPTLAIVASVTIPGGVNDLVSDGRFARVLGSNLSNHPTIWAYDLQSLTAGPTITLSGLSTLAPGTSPARIAWDGVSLYVGTGNTSSLGANFARVHPETGEILFADSFGNSVFTRGLVIQDAGTAIVGIYTGATNGLELGIAAGGFENRNFNSIGILGRPLTFLNGGHMAGIIEVNNSNPGSFDLYHNFAACNTTSGTTSVTFPSTVGLQSSWMVGVFDWTGQAATNPITVNTLGVSTEDPYNPGNTTLLNLTLNTPGVCVIWIWNFVDSVWKVLSAFNVTPSLGPIRWYTRPILAGVSSTGNTSATALRVGSLLFKPSDEITPRKVWFRAVLETTNATYQANVALTDVNNVLGNGAGAIVPGSTLSTTNTTGTELEVELNTAGGNLETLSGTALSGNFTVTNGSPTVTASANQTGVLTGGSLVVFATDPTTSYTVLSLTGGGFTVNLTTNYTGRTSLPHTTGYIPSNILLYAVIWLTTTAAGQMVTCSHAGLYVQE